MAPSPLIRLLLALALLAVPAAAGPTPFAITRIADLNVGSALPTASSGALILGLGSPPTGVRSASGGTRLGGSPSFNLGAFQITGPAGHGWTVTPASPSVTLTKGASNFTVSTSALAWSAGPSGVLPPGEDTGPIYLGLTVPVGAAGDLPSGTYSGFLDLNAQDTTAGGAPLSLSLQITFGLDPTPISLLKTSDLAFGNVLAGTLPGTVVLTPGNQRTDGGGAKALSGSFSAAAFTVSGAPLALYTIELPSGSIQLNSGVSSLSVDTFTSNPAGTGTLDALGQQSLSVGATLQVGANQTPGTYTGTFPVTVMYQ